MVCLSGYSLDQEGMRTFIFAMVSTQCLISLQTRKELVLQSWYDLVPPWVVIFLWYTYSIFFEVIIYFTFLKFEFTGCHSLVAVPGIWLHISKHFLLAIFIKGGFSDIYFAVVALNWKAPAHLFSFCLTHIWSLSLWSWQPKWF